MKNVYSEYKVESGVALPTARNRIYPFPSMAVGDSFVIDAAKVAAVRFSASHYGRRHGGKWSVRKMGDGSFRCFRIA